jgi:cysteine desulfurase/selenocysteine lyase
LKQRKKTRKIRKLIKNFLNISKNYEIIFTFGTTDSIERFLGTYLQKNRVEKFITSSWEHDAISSSINGLKGLYSGHLFEEIPLRLDENERELISKINQKIKLINENSKENTRYVFILSHVTYNYGLIIPINKIIDIIKKKLGKKALIIIDGAHAFMNIKINIKKMNPDIYVFDLYKWANGLEGHGVCIVRKNLLKKYKNSFSTIYGAIANLPNKKTISWKLNPLLDIWLANLKCLNKIKDKGINKIINKNKRLTNFFIQNINNKKVKILLPFNYYSMIGITSKNTKKLYDYLLQNKIISHYITK